MANTKIEMKWRLEVDSDLFDTSPSDSPAEPSGLITAVDLKMCALFAGFRLRMTVAFVSPLNPPPARNSHTVIGMPQTRCTLL